MSPLKVLWSPLEISKYKKRLTVDYVSCPLNIIFYYLCCLSCLCWYRKQRLSNLWQWAFHLESINAMFFEWSHCYSQPRPPLVLVSYLFHKQKKISKLGWAAIWQSVCLKLIFNTRKIYSICTKNRRQCYESWHSYTLECYSYWFALSLPIYYVVKLKTKSQWLST